MRFASIKMPVPGRTFPCCMESCLRLCILIICVLFLSACATPMGQQRASLDGRTACCQRLADLQRKPLQLGSETKIEIGETSQVFAFPSGKSYTVAFELGLGKSRGIGIESGFNGHLIGQYFQPIILFLDREQNPFSSVTPKLSFVPPALIPYTVAHMEGGVRVPDEAAYAVIFTRDFSDTKISATLPGSPTVFMSGSTPILINNPATNKPLELSPTGELRLTLISLTTK